MNGKVQRGFLHQQQKEEGVKFGVRGLDDPLQCSTSDIVQNIVQQERAGQLHGMPWNSKWNECFNLTNH